MKQLRIAILFGTLVVFLYLINSGIISSENDIANGKLAYLELAPVDPRSLIQGDYMTLAYQVERDLRDAVDFDANRGQVVLILDEEQIARFDRLYNEGETLAENEVIVNYRRQGSWAIRVGVDSFFFQEGQADDFAQAEYAEVRILESGEVMLVNLADEALEVIDPE